MTPLLLVAALNHTSAKHACYVAKQFYEVNIPIAPAVSSTEVVKTSAIFGPSKTMLGSALTLRDGKRYFADLSTQQPRSQESYDLLRMLGIQHPEKNYARHDVARNQAGSPVIPGRLMYVKFAETAGAERRSPHPPGRTLKEHRCHGRCEKYSRIDPNRSAFTVSDRGGIVGTRTQALFVTRR